MRRNNLKIIGLLKTKNVIILTINFKKRPQNLIKIPTLNLNSTDEDASRVYITGYITRIIFGQ